MKLFFFKKTFIEVTKVTAAKKNEIVDFFEYGF
jgi:hypothetical protein